MTKLEKIKIYAELLSKAAKWGNSGEAIVNVESTINEEKKKEQIYELYCLLKVVCDLEKNYTVTIKNNSEHNVFPKAPASKKNYPYFLATDKVSGRPLFQVCPGVDIIGQEGETSAPDISFQNGDAGLSPDYNDTIMLFDAKYKHALGANVSDGEFYKVAGMVKNLACENAAKDSNIDFNELVDFKGNCILTNGGAFKDNVGHHKLFHIKEVERFDEGATFNVIGR